MTDINRITIVGRLTKDAEVKYTPGGMAIVKMTVAVNRRVKKGQEWLDDASFFDVQLFGNQAKNLAQYLNKGKQIAIDGWLKQERWTKDGQTKSRLVINANDIQLLGGNKQQNQSQGYQDTGYNEADGYEN